MMTGSAGLTVRISSRTSSPLRPGSITSRITRSRSLPSARWPPSTPSAATSTAWLCARSARSTKSAMPRSSSTSRMRIGGDRTARSRRLAESTLTRCLGAADARCGKCSYCSSGTTDALALPPRRRPTRSRPATATAHDRRHRGHSGARRGERERARGGDQAGRVEGHGAGRASRRPAARAPLRTEPPPPPPPRAPPPPVGFHRGGAGDHAAGHDHDPTPAAASGTPAAGARRRLVTPASATAPLKAIGTTAIVVVEEPAVREAERLLAAELDAIDRACSRFRPDSELMRANDAAGRLTPTSPLFTEAVRIALRAAEQTEGAVDPTVAPALVALGYDRDFAAMDADAAQDVRGIPAAGWRTVALDARRRVLRMSPGCRLDLGATAKALAADRAAHRIAAATGSP